MTDKIDPLQAAYERECMLIGAAYSIICEQKEILNAATKRRAELIKQAADQAAAAEEAAKKVDESNNDRK